MMPDFPYVRVSDGQEDIFSKYRITIIELSVIDVASYYCRSKASF